MKEHCPICGAEAEFSPKGSLLNGMSADQYFCPKCGTVPAKHRHKSKVYVAVILNELRGRKGFSQWWDSIPPEDQADIVKIAESKIAKALS